MCDKYEAAGQDVDDSMAQAHCMATYTHREYLIITAFQQQLQLYKCTSILNFARTAFIVC
jgi:hypothetical protein